MRMCIYHSLYVAAGCSVILSSISTKKIRFFLFALWENHLSSITWDTLLFKLWFRVTDVCIPASTTLIKSLFFLHRQCLHLLASTSNTVTSFSRHLSDLQLTAVYHWHISASINSLCVWICYFGRHYTMLYSVLGLRMTRINQFCIISYTRIT